MWSRGQEMALRGIGRWLRQRQRNQQVFRLFGYAGTGKTEIARAIGEDCRSIYYASFTGKAAHVLRQRGCEPVSTIHKLIYDTHYDEIKRRFHHELKEPDALDDIDLIVIDEASMVDEHLATQLLSFGRPLLIIGDRAQLPPVNAPDGFFMGEKPDVMLTQIHRQARDNPILYLADRIRRGDSLPGVGYRAGQALRVTDDEDDVLDHDILLVGLNDSRHSRNESFDSGTVSRSEYRTVTFRRKSANPWCVSGMTTASTSRSSTARSSRSPPPNLTAMRSCRSYDLVSPAHSMERAKYTCLSPVSRRRSSHSIAASNNSIMATR